MPGTRKLLGAARWARSRIRGGALILGYHRIAEPGDDPFGLCVRPAHFAAQMEVLQRRANVLALDELVESLAERSLPARAAAVTFDDGYADVLHQAWPLLERHAVPAAVFVTTGYLGRSFWWDKLVEIVAAWRPLPDEVSLATNGERRRWARGEAWTSRPQLVRLLYRTLRALPAEAREETLLALRQQAGIPAAWHGRASRALTAAEVQELSASGLLTIGAHSATHPLLAELPSADQEREIDQSKACLESLTEQPVQAFSYPNGSANIDTRSLLRRAGFTSACTSVEDVARPNDDPFNLPRFWVPDWDGAKFGRWLNRWLM